MIRVATNYGIGHKNCIGAALHAWSNFDKLPVVVPRDRVQNAPAAL